jgi:hypothetical protein
MISRQKVVLGSKPMKVNVRYAIVLAVSLALSFTGPILRAKDNPQAKMKAAAIQVMMIQADRITLPAEFRVSLYENLITQLQKTGVFQRVYRDGDQNADAFSDLIVLQCAVQEFEKGSEKMRQVTTVAGATSITLRCQFMDKDRNSLLERNITGKVRFFGGNLKATSDFAKKAANVAAENFSTISERL